MGQCNISHPVRPESAFSLGSPTRNPDEEEGDGRMRSATQNLDFTKLSEGEGEPLESRIQRKQFRIIDPICHLNVRLQVFSILMLTDMR